ncbi:MAG: hypothetical protein HUJ71_10760 [Pseudobutyrivibrio sp.]|nr:hypothetical protein [Pseudobutyrivibrio sp.]
MSEKHDFKESLLNVKIPLMVLDQKWHRLFALGGKPEDVKAIEAQISELLKRQAEVKQEIKDLKKVKENLMKSVMSNMEGTSDLVSKKLDDDKRLLEECNERLNEREDELLNIPSIIEACKYQLMDATMSFCYDKLRANSKEADEITEWIKTVRVQLKKNIIRKQNREINNREIYAYMHDVFGKDILDIFDITAGEFGLSILDDKPESYDEDNTLNIDLDKSDELLEDIDLDSIEKERG